MQAPVTEAYLDWASGTQFPEDEPSSGVFLAGWQEGWHSGAAAERSKYTAILEENVQLYEMALAQAKVIRAYQNVFGAIQEACHEQGA